MSKKCECCNETFSSDRFEFCPYCKGKLLRVNNYNSNYSSNYSSDLPVGYVYDGYGHIRKDLDYERERKRENSEAFRNRY